MRDDLILAGGRIYPLGRTGLRRYTHLACVGGRVAAVGGEEVEGMVSPGTRRLELAGATVLPGFNDSHAHVVYAGLSSFGANLAGCRTVGQVQARLRRAAGALGPGEWCQGTGFSSRELVEGRPPTRWELDTAVGERPCMVDERGGHVRVASSAALAAAGLVASTPDPPGGWLGRDPDGALNGVLAESAMRLVADRQPPPSRERRRAAVLHSQRLLLSRGITSVGAAVNRGFADDLATYQLLVETGRLRIRVNQFVSWELLEPALALGLRSGFGGGRLRIGPVKVFVDGGASTGAVALRSGGGTWRTSPERLRELVAAAQGAGLQVSAHAIGDAAIEAMVEAVAAAGPEAVSARHRVEHCTACPPDLQRRVAELGMVAVMQPLFGRFRAALGAVFGEELAPHLGAHRSLLAMGARLAFSSDLPVTPDPNPWPALAAAVEDPGEGITPFQALTAYTRGGAYASFEETDKGTLEPGMRADLQVYADDPIQLGPAAWGSDLRPFQVLVGGRLAFSRAAS